MLCLVVLQLLFCDIQQPGNALLWHSPVTHILIHPKSDRPVRRQEAVVNSSKTWAQYALPDRNYLVVNYGVTVMTRAMPKPDKAGCRP
jgi:hypothetical protein